MPLSEEAFHLLQVQWSFREPRLAKRSAAAESRPNSNPGIARAFQPPREA
jgi:hypothetical protein